MAAPADGGERVDLVDAFVPGEAELRAALAGCRAKVRWGHPHLASALCERGGASPRPSGSRAASCQPDETGFGEAVLPTRGFAK
jgi:hypothetical protein